MDLFDLTGKKAIVTGSCQGLGRSIAEGLAQAGASVCLMDLNPNCAAVAREMSAGGLAFEGVTADLTDRKDLERGFLEAVGKLGGLDILVNNAGMQVRGDAEEIELSRWDKLVELNITAVFELSQLAARQMIPRGGGKIINVASMLSFFGGFRCSPYAASKGAVAQLTKACSNEWAGKGINVNAIAPGAMNTPINAEKFADLEARAATERLIPMGYVGAPEDVAAAAAWLASDQASYVTGTTLFVDGGMTLYPGFQFGQG